MKRSQWANMEPKLCATEALELLGVSCTWFVRTDKSKIWKLSELSLTRIGKIPFFPSIIIRMQKYGLESHIEAPCSCGACNLACLNEWLVFFFLNLWAIPQTFIGFGVQYWIIMIVRSGDNAKEVIFCSANVSSGKLCFMFQPHLKTIETYMCLDILDYWRIDQYTMTYLIIDLDDWWSQFSWTICISFPLE